MQFPAARTQGHYFLIIAFVALFLFVLASYVERFAPEAARIAKSVLAKTHLESETDEEDHEHDDDDIDDQLPMNQTVFDPLKFRLSKIANMSVRPAFKSTRKMPKDEASKFFEQAPMTLSNEPPELNHVLSNEYQIEKLIEMHMKETAKESREMNCPQFASIKIPVPSFNTSIWIRFCINSRLSDKSENYEAAVVWFHQALVDPSGTHILLPIPNTSSDPKSTKFIHITTIGCRKRTLEYHLAALAKNVPMIQVRQGLALHHEWGRNFFHLLGETVPRIIVAKDIVSEFLGGGSLFPEYGSEDWKSQLTFVSHLVTIPEQMVTSLGFGLNHHTNRSLQFLKIVDRTLVHYRSRVFVPLRPPCGKFSGNLMRELRQRFVGHGLDQKEYHQWLSRDVSKTWASKTHSETNSTAGKEPLKLVLILRSHSRFFEPPDAIEKLLAEHYGKEHLHIFRDPVGSFVDVIRFFASAHVLIGAHGAGLTNMIFLSNTKNLTGGGQPSLQSSAVVEIRPNRYGVDCFRQLARKLDLPTRSVKGIGKKHGALQIDAQVVLDSVRELVGY